jgi:AraC-like DNA-binding protein
LEPAEAKIDRLDAKLAQLGREYEQYFLGLRPREPLPLKGEVRALIAQFADQKLVNTALKFRLGSLSSRYQAMQRRWDDVLRRIDEGSYARHQFRASLQARPQPPISPLGEIPCGQGPLGLFEHYRDARLACGQSTAGLSAEQLSRSLDAQREQLQERFGADVEFQFQVAVEDGRAKLKARRVAR